jgi:hypothetical protein
MGTLLKRDLRSYKHVDMRKVIFNLDYRMMAEDTMPLFVWTEAPNSGRYTSRQDWHFSDDLIIKLTRLNALLDKSINWDDPKDESWDVSEEDRAEYNSLFPRVVEQLRDELGPEWELEVRPIRL